MFITILTYFYSIVVLAILAIYTSNRKYDLLKWAERRGFQNNFFIRLIRDKSKKRPNKSDLSKVFASQAEA